MKGPEEIAKVLKGAANHWRVQILALLGKNPALTLEQVAEQLKIDFRVASEHLRRMLAGGLIFKKYLGRYVQHSLTKRGKDILTFIRKLE